MQIDIIFFLFLDDIGVPILSRCYGMINGSLNCPMKQKNKRGTKFKTISRFASDFIQTKIFLRDPENTVLENERKTIKQADRNRKNQNYFDKSFLITREFKRRSIKFSRVSGLILAL